MPSYETGQSDATIREEILDGGTRAGIWKRQNAAEHRAFAGRMNETTPEAAREYAARMDAEADELLDPATYTVPVTIVTGGEAAIGRRGATSHKDKLLAYADMVAVDASRHRLTLAAKAGGLALALDASETARAENSLEKMLAHQAAAAHVAAMELQAEALVLLSEFKSRGRRESVLTTEAARLINASARLMEATQHGVLALHRLRTGGRQTFAVQHVHINDGGQAVVAGQLKGRAKARRATQDG